MGGRHVELILVKKSVHNNLGEKKKEFQYYEECLAQLYNVHYSSHVNTETSTQNFFFKKKCFSATGMINQYFLT